MTAELLLGIKNTPFYEKKLPIHKEVVDYFMYLCS